MTKITIDTNILFYAFDPRDAQKHAVAKRILKGVYDAGVPISLQCLSEFYRSATKKNLLQPTQAAIVVNDLRKGAPIIAASEPDLVSAMRIHQQHGFQFFDCLVVATAVRAGCTTLFSEDFHHTQVISALTILNPFKLRESELNKLLQ